MNEIERQLEVVLNGLEVNVSHASRAIGRATDDATASAIDFVANAPETAVSLLGQIEAIHRALAEPTLRVQVIDPEALMKRLADVHRETMVPIVPAGEEWAVEIFDRTRRQIDDIVRIMNVVGKWPPPKPKP